MLLQETSRHIHPAPCRYLRPSCEGVRVQNRWCQPTRLLGDPLQPPTTFSGWLATLGQHLHVSVTKLCCNSHACHPLNPSLHCTRLRRRTMRRNNFAREMLVDGRLVHFVLCARPPTRVHVHTGQRREKAGETRLRSPCGKARAAGGRAGEGVRDARGGAGGRGT